MYKIISNNKIIDVVKFPRFLRFLTSGYIALTDITSAQGIVGSDDTTIYSFKQINDKNYTVVTIEKITSEDEFSRLEGLLNSNQEVSANDAALLEAQLAKIDSLSSQCRSIIISGFSIKLSDGNEYNFKLTTEDQLNLMLIENQMKLSDGDFLYHATNQPCRLFSKCDMEKIIKAYKQHVLYHTTYFNATKQYIKSLVDIDDIKHFRYGTDISKYVEDVNIRRVLRNGGVFYES